MEVTSNNTTTIPESWKDPYNIECPCCLEIPKQGRIILDCKHLICVPCFVKQIQRSSECPICRVEMFKLPRPHTVARNTQTNRQQIRNSARLFQQEVNRRLQEHISEVNNIRSYVNRNRIVTPRNFRRTLRNAPPLRSRRNNNDSDSDNDNANDNANANDIDNESDNENNHNNVNANDSDSDIYEIIRSHPITNNQYIMVILFTAADIFVMLLWLYVINNKK